MEPTNSNPHPNTMPHGQQPGNGATAHADEPVRANFQHYYGPQANRPPVVVPPPSIWGKVPVLYWIGLGVGALAFVVHISSQTISSGSNGYSCSYTDIAGFATALVLVALAAGGWAQRASRQAAERLPVPLMAALTVLLLALAFVHALRGNGTIMSPCDSHPQP